MVWSAPYADVPDDQLWIRMGTDYAKRTGFKEKLFTFILLAAISFVVYKAWHFSPPGQEIVRKVKVNNLVNLYITEASAGVTTDFSYRFYLYDSSKDDKEFKVSLKDNLSPFMITEDKDALDKVENGAIYLSVKGKIYTFRSPAPYIIRGSIYYVPIYITASPF